MNVDKLIKDMEDALESELTEEEVKYFKMYKKFRRIFEKEQEFATNISYQYAIMKAKGNKE